MSERRCYTMRRCNGNRECWTYDAGSIIGETDHDLGRLIARLARRAIDAGDPCPAFVVEIDEEAEAAARRAELEAEGRKLKAENDRTNREYCRNRKRIAEIKKELAG